LPASSMTCCITASLLGRSISISETNKQTGV
jgi:hypothetical protein